MFWPHGWKVGSVSVGIMLTFALSRVYELLYLERKEFLETFQLFLSLSHWQEV